MMTRVGRAFDLGPMPYGRSMQTVDEQIVRAPLATIFELASQVELWPRYLSHYRYVRFRTRRSDGGGLVEMSANRPFQLKTPRGGSASTGEPGGCRRCRWTRIGHRSDFGM